MPPRSHLTTRAHALLAAITLVAVALQLVLVVQDAGILVDEGGRPDLATRLARFVSYFTIQSNLLVLVVAAAVARGVDVARPGWQVLRLSALTGIAVTGIVHWVALRPLLDLSGGPWVADKLLHVVVPLAALLTWALVGPHGLGGWVRIGQALVWPAAWAAFTLVRGAATGWYPYPFLDAGELGAAHTGVNVLAIGVFFSLVAVVVLLLDRRWARTDPPAAH